MKYEGSGEPSWAGLGWAELSWAGLGWSQTAQSREHFVCDASSQVSNVCTHTLRCGLTAHEPCALVSQLWAVPCVRKVPPLGMICMHLRWFLDHQGFRAFGLLVACTSPVWCHISTVIALSVSVFVIIAIALMSKVCTYV